MIKSQHPNFIESDEGFSITVLTGGREGLVYREAGRAVKVLSEIAVEPVGYIIYENSIKEWAPPGSEQWIDESARAKILENLRRGFLSQGYKIEINRTTSFRDAILRELQRIED